MASKQDYVAVAAIIRKQYDLVRDPEVPTSASVALEEVVIDLATLYAEGNPAFDARKFHLAALGHADALTKHGPVPTTWWTRGVWPTCSCGYDPHDNTLLTAHWAEHGFEVIDEHGRLIKHPINSSH